MSFPECGLRRRTCLPVSDGLYLMFTSSSVLLFFLPSSSSRRTSQWTTECFHLSLSFPPDVRDGKNVVSWLAIPLRTWLLRSVSAGVRTPGILASYFPSQHSLHAFLDRMLAYTLTERGENSFCVALAIHVAAACVGGYCLLREEVDKPQKPTQRLTGRCIPISVVRVEWAVPYGLLRPRSGTRVQGREQYIRTARTAHRVAWVHRHVTTKRKGL